MQFRSFTLAIGVAFALAAGGAVTAPLAPAAGSLYATESEATQACGADEVVWVDLDRGRFYHKSQADYGKSKNGGYSCMKTAHAQYRPGHD